MEGLDLVNLFVGIGLSEVKAKETAKNSNVSANLKSCINAVRKTSRFGGDIDLLFTMPIKNSANPDLF